MDYLKDFDLRHPWNLLGAAGALILVASFMLISVSGFLIGLGLLSCGIGDMINRPEHMDVTAGERPGNDIRHGTDPWKPNPVGRLLSAAGLILLVFGLAAMFGFLRLPFAQ
jgi:hypothetical protein